MNKIERIVYNLLKSNPAIKNQVRNLYQNLFDLVPAREKITNYEIINHPGFYYGFHDHSPFSYDNKRVLANKYNFDLKMPKKDDYLIIGFFSDENFSNYTEIDISFAWNWHMGCKLQWVGEGNSIIFNNYLDGHFCSVLVDIDNSNKHIYEAPISSVSPNAKLAVGYNFKRVNKLMPGYGYIHHNKISFSDEAKVPDNDGIYLVDILNKTKKDLISIRNLIDINSENSMKEAYHFFTHAVFSPCSKKIAFLHRWKMLDEDINKRKSRLVIINLQGEVLLISNTNGMVSHFCWRDSENIIAYCNTVEYGDNYHLIKLGGSGSIDLLTDSFTSDGHPSCLLNTAWMVTDTYPNRKRMQNLYIYNIQLNQKYHIASFRMDKDFQSPNALQHWSCDLHPRWDRLGNYVCFDSVYSGKRALSILKLGDHIEKNNIFTI